MRLRLAAALTVLSCLLLTGCGGSGGSGAATASGGGKTLEQLWRAEGDDVAVVPGTQNYVPGNVRVSFLVIDSQGRAVTLPTARVWVSDALDRTPFLETEAKIERIGIPGGETADATHIYVVHLRLPRVGKYWLLAEPDGGPKKVQALGNVVVVKDDPPLDIGDRAPASATPTLASTHGDVSALTTRTPPDLRLLRYSVAGSLEAHVPFVVTFATPKFCSSRLCGPMVDVLDDVAQKLDGHRCPLHPRRGLRRQRSRERLQPVDEAVGARNGALDLLVSRRGVIVARFEGSVSVEELEAAVRAKLAPPDWSDRIAEALDDDVGHTRHRAQCENGADQRRDVLGLDLLLVRKPRPLGHSRRHEARRDRSRADAVGLLLPVQRVA